MIKVLLIIVIIGVQACREELRGDVEKSSDGKTYLVFKEGCDSIYVNGEFWPYKLGTKGEVPSGTCEIGCDRDRIDLSIKIENGTIFYFDYWGP